MTPSSPRVRWKAWLRTLHIHLSLFGSAAGSRDSRWRATSCRLTLRTTLPARRSVGLVSLGTGVLFAAVVWWLLVL